MSDANSNPCYGLILILIGRENRDVLPSVQSESCENGHVLRGTSEGRETLQMREWCGIGSFTWEKAKSSSVSKQVPAATAEVRGQGTRQA